MNDENLLIYNISDTPFISVILPVYNMESFVGNAMDSILQQTFRDFELLVIDDGSTDNSLKIISSFKDERIRIIRNLQNKGNYASRNIGIQQTRGKYIAVMDADDIAFSDRLSAQYTYMEEHPEILAVGTRFLFLNTGEVRMNPVSYEDICAGLLNDNCLLHPSLLIRTEILYQLGCYNENYKYASDYDLVCRLSLLGKIENLPEPYMKYRLHERQISQKNFSEQRGYAEKIQREYQIAYINMNKLPEQSKVSEAEVGCLNMGRVIGLYIMNQKYPGKSFDEQADKLLDDIFLQISHTTSVKILNGLLGIACGLIYLLRNRLVSGNEDEVLENVDFLIFNVINYRQKNDALNWVDMLYYLRKRTLPPAHNANELQVLKNKQTILYLLDSYERSLNGESLREQLIKEELKSLYAAGLFQNKMERLFNKHISCNENDSLLMSVDKTSVSFVIPVRIDSAERARNLSLVVEHLSEMENVLIIILEADKTPLVDPLKYSQNIWYHFIEDRNEVFHRTKYINLLLQIAPTSIVGVWDTDVLIPVSQIKESVREIQEGHYVFSFPYDGCFYDLSIGQTLLYQQQRDLHLLEEKEVLETSFGTYSVGGAFLVNKTVYMLCGGENEHFYGWGAEDLERVQRMKVLGHNIHRTSGSLYHLNHPRNNSQYVTEEIQIKSIKELLKVSNMKSSDLREYISTWEWLLFPEFV